MDCNVREIKADIDRATLLWYRQDRDDWEMLEAVGLFRKHGLWNYQDQEPHWHDIKAEAIFIGECLHYEDIHDNKWDDE